MPLPLVVYGTLRDPELLVAVLDRPLRPQAVHAVRAPGFLAVHYPHRVYPALVRAPGAAADGLLLTDLTAFELDLLDAFEGDEYRRSPVAVMVAEELHEADAYLPATAVPASAPSWSLDRWQREHKSRVLAADRMTAAQLRQRLIAVRPN